MLIFRECFIPWNALFRSECIISLSPFCFYFLRKCQHGNHSKFGEALYFYIHPPFGQKTLFSHIYTFFIQIWQRVNARNTFTICCVLIFSVLELFVLRVTFSTIGSMEHEIWTVDWISDLLFWQLVMFIIEWWGWMAKLNFQ